MFWIVSGRIEQDIGMENKATPCVPMTIQWRENNIPSTLDLLNYQPLPNAATYSVCPKKLACWNGGCRWDSLLVFFALWVFLCSRAAMEREGLVTCRGQKNSGRVVSGRAPLAARHPNSIAGWRGGGVEKGAFPSLIGNNCGNLEGEKEKRES